MTNDDANDEVRNPGVMVILISVLLGAAMAYALSTYWLNLSPAWLALLVGAVCSLIGFFILGESIGDAIVFSVIFSVLTLVVITAGPDTELIRMNIVPVATGICMGKLIHGIWDEIG